MKVKIKTWEQMEKEFGLDGDGAIACTFGFINEMEQELPEDRIIVVRVVPNPDSPSTVYLCGVKELRHWWFSYDMIEEIIEE